MYTIQDFIKKGIVVTFQNAAEQAEFLKECEKAGLRWNGEGVGEKATEFMPHIGDAIHFMTVSGRKRLLYASKDFYNDLGTTLVPFASFSFAPRQELHITSDGLTTHAVHKVDGKIVGRGKATCNPSDEYDFKTGAWLAMARVFDKPVPKKPAKVEPKYREVKRAAKAGEKIKVVHAKHTYGKHQNGDTLTVEYSADFYVRVVEHKRFLPHFEYVVLEEIK